MSLFSDPVKWAEPMTKGKVRLVLFILVHCCFLTAGLWSIYDAMVARGLDAGFSFTEFLRLSIPIFFIGALFPSMYLYSMYRMINIIKGRS